MVDIALLKQAIVDQNTLVLPKHLYQRQAFAQLSTFSILPHVVVISGIRRCGKSTLLQQLRQQQTEQAYYLNFDDDRLLGFHVEDFQTMLEIFIELYGEQSTFYFDEIQNIEGWERFVRRLHDQGKKVYVTGSNANMLSRELGTRLTGRYVQCELYPLSFKEIFMRHKPLLVEKSTFTTAEKSIIKQHFSDYLLQGGLPEYVATQSTEVLQLLYQNILYRDIIVRYRLQELPLKELMYFLVSNVGKEVSFGKLAKVVGVKNGSTVSEYCHYLENSYLNFLINRYDPSVKRQMLFNKKTYAIDQGMVRAIGFRPSDDRGRMLENVVFIELKRRGCDVYFHRQQKECDFLIRKGTRIVEAIQVCQQMTDADTQKREYAGLVEAMQYADLTQGLILTEDTFADDSVEADSKHYTIAIRPIWWWLLQQA